jgi:hypothetical protein
MPQPYADILKRLRLAAVDAFPCATAEMISAAQEELGFRLPALLRAVYLRVGNGGFGPGYGLIGVGGAEPYTSTHQSVQDLYDREVHNSSSGDTWPEGLLPICDYGCANFACVDCSRKSARVLRVDADAYLRADVPSRRKSLRLERESLEEWFEDWLRE